MSLIRLLFILFCLSTFIIIIIPIQITFNIFKLNVRYTFPVFFYRVIKNITGIRINVIGLNDDKQKKPGILYIANHVSWFDILCLGAVLNARFIAKREVLKMGIFGFLARLSNTFFIDNLSKNKITEYSSSIRKKLISGESLILFPEGTTSDGNGIKKFKSSLMECVNSNEELLNVQPVSICYTLKNNLPMGIFNRRYIAWVGQISMVASMQNFLSTGSITVNLLFHPKTSIDKFNNRKELSVFCENEILNGINQVIKI